MTAIAIVLLALAVVLNAGVTAWMLWHYRRGMMASSAWLDGLTAAATANQRGMRHEATGIQEPTIRAKVHPLGTDVIDWATDHLVTPAERQDDEWVAEIDAQNEADAMLGVE